MVQAYYMQNSPNMDQRLPNQLEPPEPVDIDELYRKTGVQYFKISNDDMLSKGGQLAALKKERGYTYEDVCEVTKNTPEEKVKMFFEEHLHSDEEIRLILEGCGYFDVRDNKDRWIRILVEKGDLIIVPAGIYHRFTVNEDNYVKAMRLFVGEPIWTPINRPADEHPARQEYLKNLEHSYQNGISV